MIRPEAGPCFAAGVSRSSVSRGGHLVCYGLLGAVLLYGLIARIGEAVVPDRGFMVDLDRVHVVSGRMDPNTASWAELATLPRIGEVLAKRIVAHREDFQARQPASGRPAIAFSSLADLDSVKGIGPKTLEKLRDHLVFPSVEGGQGR